MTESIAEEQGDKLDESTRREQFKLIYDYIKFHIGLYLSTPAVIGLLGRSFGVEDKIRFKLGLIIMICLYVVAGAHAGWFISDHVNSQWRPGYLDRFEKEAFCRSRVFWHHWMYWIGLAAGLAGLLFAKCHS